MKVSKLAEYLERLENTSSRIEITKILVGLFKQSTVDEIDKITYLILGKLAPDYNQIVFNIAEKMMLRAVAAAYNVGLDEVKENYKKMGDIGEVVSLYAKKNKLHDLEVLEMYADLKKIALDEGEGSQERKIKNISELISRLNPRSAKYVSRIPVGKLRLGFSDKTILDALSWMEKGDKSAKKQLDFAYQVMPDVGLLAKSVFELGIEKATKTTRPKVGIPVLPMLAQRLKKPVQMIEKMGKVALEPKFDGLRIQIHYKSGKNGFVKAFTRNLNENSWMFPELKRLNKYLKAKEVILDTEAVGVDEKRQLLVSFQSTMTRRRKHDIEKYSTKTPIKFYVFDLLSVNGENCLEKDFVERKRILKKTISNGSLLEYVDYILTDKANEIAEFNKKERKLGYEGIMVKKSDSFYVPGRTGFRWVKMKEGEESEGKLADTIDCLILGYTRGKGKRAGFGMGQFLAAVKKGSEFVTITKVGTGLADEQFKQLAVRLEKIGVDKKPKEYLVNKDYYPDYWVSPKEVVEIAGDDISKSPKHTSGYAIRFPRLVRFRDDKSPSQVTNMGEIIKLFKLQ